MMDSSHDATRRLLRQTNLRATPARVAVWECLAKSSGPLTHVEVAERLAKSVVDKSTIFRVLQDFVEGGIVRRLDVGDHVWRYEQIAPSAKREPEHGHPHLLCVECGSVTCLEETQVKLRLPQSVGAVEEVLLKGRCAPCRDAEPRS